MNDWIIHFISHSGYGGVAFLMVLENVFPPIPSELIMPFAGYAAARGELNLWGVVTAGTVGSLLGNLPWYLVARWGWVQIERFRTFIRNYGRWFTISERDLENACQWFEKYGYAAVLLARVLPAFRTLISVPAGFVKLPILPFLLFSAIGSLLWTAMLTLAGYYLADQYEEVSQIVNFLTDGIVLAAVAVYVYRLITFKKTH